MSLLANKQSGGNIEIDSKELTRALTPNQQYLNYIHYKTRSNSSDSLRLSHDSEMDAKKQLSKNKINLKLVKMLQEKFDPEAEETKKLYNPISKADKKVVQELDSYIEYKELLAETKREHLYRVWNDHVYDTLRRKIKDSFNWPEIRKKKLALYDQYLDCMNKKGIVFLNTTDPTEIYTKSMNAKQKEEEVEEEENKSKSPVISEANKEDGDIVQGTVDQKISISDFDIDYAPLPLALPLGRDSVTNDTWLKVQLGDIESPLRKASRQRMRGILHKSSINLLTTFSKPSSDPNIFIKEMNIQKKRMYSVAPAINNTSGEKTDNMNKPKPNHVSFIG